MYQLWRSIKVPLTNRKHWHFNTFFYLTVTDINVHLITPVVCIICMFYTSMVSHSRASSTRDKLTFISGRYKSCSLYRRNPDRPYDCRYPTSSNQGHSRRGRYPKCHSEEFGKWPHWTTQVCLSKSFSSNCKFCLVVWTSTHWPGIQCGLSWLVDSPTSCKQGLSIKIWCKDIWPYLLCPQLNCMTHTIHIFLFN